jgi:hypothetical protein
LQKSIQKKRRKKLLRYVIRFVIYPSKEPPNCMSSEGRYFNLQTSRFRKAKLIVPPLEFPWTLQLVLQLQHILKLAGTSLGSIMACKSPTPQQNDVAWRGIITLLDKENAES